MGPIKWQYFQFRKAHGYQVYLRLKQEDLANRLNHLLHELGFNELSDQEARKLDLTRSGLKMLTVQPAPPALNAVISGPQGLEKFGAEVLSLHQGMPVYIYRQVAWLLAPENKSLWDLALWGDFEQTEQMVALRIVLVRFLSMALSQQGVLSYWGTVKDETLIIMKQSHSFGEAVLIDWSKRLMFFNGGEAPIKTPLKILRKDKELRSSFPLSREELISFLGVNTCLMSFHGLTSAMKKSLVELSGKATASYLATEASRSEINQ
jgi:hypothetical protein